MSAVAEVRPAAPWGVMVEIETVPELLAAAEKLAD